MDLSVNVLIVSALLVKFLPVITLNPTTVVSALCQSKRPAVDCDVCFRASWSQLIPVKPHSVCKRSNELLSSPHPKQWLMNITYYHLTSSHLHTGTEDCCNFLPNLALVLNHLVWGRCAYGSHLISKTVTFTRDWILNVEIEIHLIEWKCLTF